MKERPIIFSGPMVRAILEGRKTQTRRVIRPQPRGCYSLEYHMDGIAYWKLTGTPPLIPHPAKPGKRMRALLVPFCRSRCPYGQPGDRLWVREAAYIALPNFGDSSDANCVDSEGHRRLVGYAASMDSDSVRCATDYGVKLSPSIHMPRWASRLTLEISKIRVERVQKISEEDAIAEGVRLMRDGSGVFVGREGPGRKISPWPTAREAFGDIWDSINSARGFGWDVNPWVWVIEFRKL